MDGREFQALSVRTLERMTSIDRGKWSRYFNGLQSMRQDTLIRVAEELKMSPEELFGAILQRRTAISIKSVESDISN